MSLQRPRAVLEVDGQKLTSAEAALVRAHVRLSLGGSHDPAELILWPSSKFAQATPGSTLKIALGNVDEEEDVWAGEVTEVAGGQDGVIIAGLAGTAVLSRTRVSRTYVDQSVSDIARDLAADVDIDEVAGDTKLSAYTVDDRRTVWSHLIELGRLVGAEPSSSPSGAFRFVTPRTGSADITLRYGADILSWTSGSGSALPTASVLAYGAASEAGAEQWHWILRASAGTAAAGTVANVGALRTRDAADAMAQALTDRAARAALHGELRILGRPGIRPGDLIEATDLPSGDPGTLRVRAVDHMLDSRGGFITTLSVEGTS
jgi:hypothetical protein